MWSGKPPGEVSDVITFSGGACLQTPLAWVHYLMHAITSPSDEKSHINPIHMCTCTHSFIPSECTCAYMYACTCTWQLLPSYRDRVRTCIHVSIRLCMTHRYSLSHLCTHPPHTHTQGQTWFQLLHTAQALPSLVPLHPLNEHHKLLLPPHVSPVLPSRSPTHPPH